MIVTSSVSGRKARMNSPKSRLPSRSTPRKVTSQPSRASSLHTPSTAGCSTAVVMTWRRLGLAFGRAKDGRVVALRRTTGKQNHIRIAQSEKAGDFRSGSLDRRGRRPGRLVHRTRIEVLRRQKRHHRLDHFRGHPRGGVVVGVDNVHVTPQSPGPARPPSLSRSVRPAFARSGWHCNSPGRRPSAGNRPGCP